MRPSRVCRGFTLIELLVVVAIIAVVASFVVPAATTILRGSQITQASQILTDQISLARQQALSKNRSIEVRFVQYADPELPGESVANPKSGKFRAIQLLQVNEAGVPVPLGKLQPLPSSIMMNPDTYSSLLDQSSSPAQPIITPTPQDPPLPRNVGMNYDYTAFRFLPDGSTNLVPTKADGWYVTIHSANDYAKLTSGSNGLQGVNFYTLQIDPVSGTTRGYRPTAK